MGEVYRAHDQQLDRDVAIKVLRPGFDGDLTERSRLLQEARAVAALNHPHVCTIHEVGETDGQVYIAMELIEGQSLDGMIPPHGMPADQVLRYGLQIVDAVAHAHNRRVVHRDLKSGNIIVTPQGRAKVLDFGLAKRTSVKELSDATTAAEGETIAGTLPYMAPELLRGDGSDARSDVWALGVILFEMAAGARPFQSRTHYELSSIILKEPAKPLPDSVPVGLKAIIGRCLEKEPARRYQRASELLAALEAIEASTRPRRTIWRPQLTRRSWFALTAAVILAVSIGLGLRQTRTRPSSLVVLPWDNLTGDAEQEYFVAAIQDALTGELGQISALRVISRTSAMAYKGTRKSVPEIARELNVDVLVEASVFKAGETLRVQVQLIQAVPVERQLWSRSYDGNLRNVLAMQKQVARAIVEEIQVTVTPQEAKRLSTAPTVDPAAYDAWAKGWFQYIRSTQDSMYKCIEYAETALAIDSKYAPAYALTALCYNILGNIAEVDSNDVFPKAEAAAIRALELDESLSDAHFARAWTHAVYRWDWQRAEEEFRRGLDLNPSSANGRSRFGWFLSWIGRFDEAIAEATRGIQLNPIGLYEIQTLAAVFLTAQRYDDAIVTARRAIDIDPTYAFGHNRLGIAYMAKEMYTEAIATLETAVKVSGGSVTHKGLLGRAYALSGRHSEARKILEDGVGRYERINARPIEMAMIEEAMGEKEKALYWLEEGYRVRDGNMILLKVWPIWEALRDDARFQDLLKRMRFP